MLKKKKILLLVFALILFCSLSIFLYVKLSSVQSLATFKEWFAPSFSGYSLYFVLVVLQVLFVPISTMLLIVPALIMFGAWHTFLITLFALMVGSVVTYYLGFFCRKFAIKLIEKNGLFMKWYNELEKNGKFLLPYFSIIPIFPDEIICLLAGITKTNFKYFFVVTLIARASHLIFICFLGAIIPMHGWWLLLWLGLLVVISYVCYLMNKKQNQIKDWFVKKLSK